MAASLKADHFPCALALLLRTRLIHLAEMRLYHFTTQTFGLRALEDRRLKIARINELNDPFEFLSWNVQDAANRAKLRAWKSAQNDRLGIVCFSRNWSNPLLWSQYAEKHQGMALGFDVPESDLYSPVKYQRLRVRFNATASSMVTTSKMCCLPSSPPGVMSLNIGASVPSPTVFETGSSTSSHTRKRCGLPRSSSATCQNSAAVSLPTRLAPKLRLSKPSRRGPGSAPSRW